MSHPADPLLASRVVNKMLEQDTYGKWLNPSIEKISAGYCLMKMKVRQEFLNGVGTVHGGIVFGIADTAFAYASNSHNRIAVALDVSISYPNAGQLHDEFTIEAKEVYLGGRTAIYQVMVTNQSNQLIGIFNGTVFRTQKKYFEEDV
ncbi:MAG: hotdog fold thioesterase [Chitinophagaceae bacterium]|nr:hotdog fold thioesterase [Chitinophagaceae bacterium]